MNITRPLLALLLSSATTLACSRPEPTSGVSEDALEERIITSAPGPLRLRGSCVAGTETASFNPDVFAPEYVYVGSGIGDHGSFIGTVDVSVTMAEGVMLAVFESSRQELWSGSSTPGKKKTKAVALGEAIAFEDDSLLAAGPVRCEATLVQDRASRLFVDEGTSAPLDRISTARLETDLLLPGSVSCGLALDFTSPLRSDAVQAFHGSVELEPFADVSIWTATGASRFRPASLACTPRLSR